MLSDLGIPVTKNSIIMLPKNIFWPQFLSISQSQSEGMNASICFLSNSKIGSISSTTKTNAKTVTLSSSSSEASSILALTCASSFESRISFKWAAINSETVSRKFKVFFVAAHKNGDGKWEEELQHSIEISPTLNRLSLLPIRLPFRRRNVCR